MTKPTKRPSCAQHIKNLAPSLELFVPIRFLLQINLPNAAEICSRLIKLSDSRPPQHNVPQRHGHFPKFGSALGVLRLELLLERSKGVLGQVPLYRATLLLEGGNP